MVSSDLSRQRRSQTASVVGTFDISIRQNSLADLWLLASRGSLVVPEGAYHGHAYLETSIIKHDGSNAQNVTFWFQRYAPHEHTASLTVREDDDIGHAGNGLVLLTAGE